MKKYVLLFLLLISFNSFSQKDSIINYFDRKGKITADKSKIRFFEIITKSTGSKWLTKRYRKNGKQFAYWYTKDKARKTKTGESVTYHKSGKIASIAYYNSEGKKQGAYKSWFNNTEKNIQGIYLNDQKAGVWKYYHYNGKLASKKIYKNDSLLRSSYYNDKGIEINHDKKLCLAPAKFKGGHKAFSVKIKELYPKLGYKIKGKLFVNITVNVYGKITDVTIDEELSEDLKNKIITFFENIKGWSPATEVHRKVPFNFSIPLKFRG